MKRNGIDATTASDSLLEDSAYRKICLRIVPILFACYLIAYLDRINVSFAKLEMLSDTGLGNAAYAVGASLFFWSYMIFEVPSNIILRRVGGADLDCSNYGDLGVRLGAHDVRQSARSVFPRWHCDSLLCAQASARDL